MGVISVVVYSLAHITATWDFADRRAAFPLNLPQLTSLAVVNEAGRAFLLQGPRGGTALQTDG